MARDIRYKLPQLDINDDEIALPKNERFIIDSDWVTIGLMSDSDEYTKEDLRYQFRSPVFSETMSTTIGSHFCINPVYSWGPQSDMHYPGRVSDNKLFTPDTAHVDIGMGRYYSEAIQTNSKVRTLIIEAGVPEFTNIFSFLINAVDKVKVNIAREGRTPFFYNAGYGVGTAITLVAFPVFTIGLFLASYTTKRVFGMTDVKYYYVKPTMTEFWARVNAIVNTISADAGFLTMDTSLMDKVGGGKYPEKRGQQVRINEEDKKLLSDLMPHIFKNNETLNVNGLIDMAGIASRYQKLLNDRINISTEALSGSGDIDKYVADIKRPTGTPLETTVEAIKNTSEYSDDLNSKVKGNVPDANNSTKNVTLDSLLKPEGGPGGDPRKKMIVKKSDGWFDSFFKYYDAGVKAGHSVLALQVEYVGSSSDTFSNTVKDIPLKSMMNSTSSRIRDIRFSMSDGNWFGDTVGQLSKAVGDLAGGVIDGATLGLSNIFKALNGNGNIDFPKMWDDSSAQIASHTFKIRLTSPYGNKISNLLDLYMPLACILAMTLPKEIGNNAYTSPPLLKTFLRGVMNADISMVTSLSITRGGGNLGHTNFGAPLDFDISLQISDLTDTMSSPTPDGLTGLFSMSLDEYSTFNRYSKLITGQSYAYSKFIRKQAVLRLTKQYGSLTALLSPEFWGVRLSDSFIGEAHKMFVPSFNVSGIDMWDN